MKRSFALATMIALGAAAYLPLPSMAQTNFSVVIGSAPPAPRFESVPAPRHGYVWAPGYWNWDGHRHAWMAGRWETARHGYHYQPAEWMRERDGYRMRQGGWVQVSDRGHDVIRVAPPPPRYERSPSPRAGYVFQPGHWEWNGRRHTWIPGVWIVERPGYEYRSHSWHRRDGGWYMEQPGWTQRGRDRDRDGIPDWVERRHADRDRDGVPDRLEHRGDRHDRDRDGVDDRYDRDLDNDGVSNRRDADRDGDGVRNDYDRRPDNVRRY
jgi:hypothetical protein